MQAPVAHTPPKACGLAVTSLVCGCLGSLFAFITGIPAIITGHMALGKIKRGGGTVGGSGMATTGLILGYVTTTVLTLVWILVAALATPAIFKGIKRAEMVQNVSNAKQLHMGLITYSMDNDGEYPRSLRALKTEAYVHDIDALRYKDDKKSLDWTYFPGLKDGDSYDSILIAAPMPTKGGTARIVGFLDGSVRPIPEAEYQRKIRDQQSAESPSGP